MNFHAKIAIYLFKVRLQIEETPVIHDCAAFDSLNVNVKSFE